MRTRWLSWIWRHRKLSLGVALLTAFLFLNVVAFLHARAMTHFTTGGARTGNPETLSVWGKAKIFLTGVNIPRPTNRTTPDSLGLPFEVQRFQGAAGQNLEAWFIPRADAKGLVVLFHGYSASKGNVLTEAKAFHVMGYDTFLVDFRGSGGSDGNETTIGVVEADDVVSAVAHVRAHWPERRLILFGQSMGSVAILRAVGVLGVRADTLILECPFDRLLATVGNRFGSMGLPQFPMAHLLVFWGGWQQGFNGFDHNPVEYARGVHCPVLLLQGGKDLRVTPAQAETIFANLPGDKQFELFEEVGHVSYVTAAPERWQAWVGGFLDRWIGNQGAAR